ncbi:ABC transporter permease [Demequina sp. NBRC 110052]|uniref:ABC transporter permease n=1 Tax=Demequina sp. NBRC 110052 TaxID=1570341 RepID=UPI0009FD03AD|nr:ABC transporter permease [Demequina sp. NBRC 110052]
MADGTAAVLPSGMTAPGGSASLFDIGRHRYLLRLVVRKEMRVRYQGSLLGLAWTYVKPAVQFAVFYFVMGTFLGMSARISPFAVFLFSGMVIVNLFTEILTNSTRSVTGNAPLVRKIYLPRQLFPVSSVFVALAHFAPQVVILVLGALVSGWTPDVVGLLAGLAGTAIVVCLALGVGLITAAINVAFRDIENITDLIAMVAVWFSPVLYPWSFVRDAFVDYPALLNLYFANPLTVAVELFHRAFWAGAAQPLDRPDGVLTDLWTHAAIAGAVSVVVLLIGDFTFRRMSYKFAQEL